MKYLRRVPVLATSHDSLQAKLSLNCLANHHHALVFRSLIQLAVVLNVLLKGYRFVHSLTFGLRVDIWFQRRRLLLLKRLSAIISGSCV